MKGNYFVNVTVDNDLVIKDHKETTLHGCWNAIKEVTEALGSNKTIRANYDPIHKEWRGNGIIDGSNVTVNVYSITSLWGTRYTV